MSVFAGGCELSAFAGSASTTSSPAGRRVLDELVRTSFATVNRADDRTRYRLLEPVRQFAAALLDACGADLECHRRHLRTTSGSPKG